MVVATGQIQIQAPVEEVDFPCRSHRVNFSNSTKDSLVDDDDVTTTLLPQDSTESTTVPIIITPIHDNKGFDSSFVRLDVIAPVPIKASSRHHVMDDNSSIITNCLATSDSVDSSVSVSSTPTATARLSISEYASTTCTSSPAVGKTEKRKEYVKNDRRSFSGSLDLDRLKLYVKQNGEFNVLFEEENPGKGLVVQRNWTFQEFLIHAGRKIGMPNASRAFSRLGMNDECIYLYVYTSIRSPPFPHLSLENSLYLFF